MHEFNLRFAMAWLSACAVALLIRYAWKQAPFKPRPATLVAAVLCFSLFLVFHISRQPDDPAIMSTGLMWGILMVVARSILIGGSGKQATFP